MVFNLRKIDTFLGRALVQAFSSELYQLSDFSLLSKLKAARPMHKEKVFRHTLGEKEAVALYSHLMRKRKGEANEFWQMKELDAILKGYSLSLNELKGTQRR